jgi:hypothetical protein
LGDGLRIYTGATHGIEVFEMGAGKMRVERLSIGIHLIEEDSKFVGRIDTDIEPRAAGFSK